MIEALKQKRLQECVPHGDAERFLRDARPGWNQNRGLPLSLNRPREHDCKRGGEHIQRCAADGLIRLEVDGGKRKQHREDCARQPGNEDCKEHGPLRVRGTKAARVHIAQKQAGAKCADDHDAFQRDIDHAAALREHAAQGNEQQGDHKHNGCADDIR
ncbi:hypothetical protein SDC9_122414 [bioreactor metagenome]|uniref:Uncharacterized protein n=1 Tax=bioreactor metagenome TaxID=1076179 RepID=A0A645CEQ8_9ZZZZ